MTVLIYSDGSSKGNPGPGAWAAIVADEKEVRELGGAEAHTTNNRMELTAALEALKYCKEKYPTANLILRTDSEYVVNGATKWGSAWRRRGWKTVQGQDVLSRDLWEPLLQVVGHFGTRLKWESVRGHVEIPGNERVDEIAQALADGAALDLYSGARGTYGVDLESTAGSGQRLEGRSRSRSAAYSYVSEVEGAVEVHATWSECERRVRGKKARFKKALSAEDERRIVRDFSV